MWNIYDKFGLCTQNYLIYDSAFGFKYGKVSDKLMLIHLNNIVTIWIVILM